MATAQPLVDHDRIREWAEARGAQPACVKGTGGTKDTGMIRLDFPGFSGGESLRKISWKEWFRKFDDNNLALLVQERTGRGQQSNFNKLVTRTADPGRKRTRGAASPRATAADRKSSGPPAAKGRVRSRKTTARPKTKRARSATAR